MIEMDLADLEEEALSAEEEANDPGAAGLEAGPDLDRLFELAVHLPVGAVCC